MREAQIYELRAGVHVDQVDRDGTHILKKDYTRAQLDKESGQLYLESPRGVFLQHAPSSNPKDEQDDEKLKKLLARATMMETMRSRKGFIDDVDLGAIDKHDRAPSLSTDNHNKARSGIVAVPRREVSPARENESEVSDEDQEPEHSTPDDGDKGPNSGKPGEDNRDDQDEGQDGIDEDPKPGDNESGDEQGDNTDTDETHGAFSRRSGCFYRVLGARKNLGPAAPKGKGKIVQDPVERAPNPDFEVKQGEIVLDLQRPRLIRHGLLTTMVRKVDGKEGWVYTRRLQKYEGAFGLRRKYHRPSGPSLESKLAKESKDQLSQRAKDLKIKHPRKRPSKDDLIELIVDKVEESWYLEVYTVRQAVQSSNGFQVDYGTNEYVIEHQDDMGLELEPSTIAVRDIDGQLGVLPTTAIKKISEQGWGLKLYHSRSLHRKRQKDDSEFRDHGNDTEDEGSVLSDEDLSYIPDKLDFLEDSGDSQDSPGPSGNGGDSGGNDNDDEDDDDGKGSGANGPKPKDANGTTKPVKKDEKKREREGSDHDDDSQEQKERERKKRKILDAKPKVQKAAIAASEADEEEDAGTSGNTRPTTSRKGPAKPRGKGARTRGGGNIGGKAPRGAKK